VVDGAIVPVIELPPASPFTCQVTVVFVVVEELDRFTVATNWVVVLTGTVAVVGVMEIEVIFAAPPLPLPQAERVNRESPITANAQTGWVFRSIKMIYLQLPGLGLMSIN
jgi:hypothetical protein